MQKSYVITDYLDSHFVYKMSDIKATNYCQNVVYELSSHFIGYEFGLQAHSQ